MIMDHEVRDSKNWDKKRREEIYSFCGPQWLKLGVRVKEKMEFSTGFLDSDCASAFTYIIALNVCHHPS